MNQYLRDRHTNALEGLAVRHSSTGFNGIKLQSRCLGGQVDRAFALLYVREKRGYISLMSAVYPCTPNIGEVVSTLST